MFFPKTVFVAGVRIRVVRRDLSEDDCFGLWSHDSKTIIIDSNLSGNDLLGALRHEVLEASFSLSGLAWCEGPISTGTEGIIRCLDEIFFPVWDPLHDRMRE